jgi:phage terminase large subunit-like protein
MRPPEEPPSDLPNLFGRFARALRDNWRTLARPAQIPPEDFSVFVELGGRGSGKTWSAAHYVCEQAASGAAMRIALVGATASDVRFTMVEGVSGILACSRPGERPEYEPGKNQLTWPSGAIARLYSADTPDALRGPEHDLSWCDELAAWRRADEAWSNLMFGLRAGTRPRAIVTTTPRPTRLIRDLVSRDGQDGVVVRRTSTYDNAKNLPPSYFKQLIRRFEGTRLARQELHAELLQDTPGALWTREILEETRVESAPPLQRIVIGVDPAGSTSEGADLTGIVACGIGLDQHLYLLHDLSLRGTPREWASKVMGAYHALRADKVVVETNFGGQMAAATLASVDSSVPVKEISSSRGKVLRAEPIGSLFEQKRAHVVGSLPELEDEMSSFTSDWDRARDGSPDRVDAMVFAATELMLTVSAGGYFQAASLLVDGEPVPAPFRPRDVFAVGVASEGQDSFGVLYLARMHAEMPYELVVLDWTLHAVDAELFAGPWLAGVFERQAAFEPLSDISSLWIREAGIGAALLRQGQEVGLNTYNIDEPLELPPDLPTLVSDVSSEIHGGKVKITADAYAKHQTHASLTRNHFVAHLEAYKVGAEEPADCSLLKALCIGVMLASPTDVRQRKRRARR